MLRSQLWKVGKKYRNRNKASLFTLELLLVPLIWLLLEREGSKRALSHLVSCPLPIFYVVGEEKRDRKRETKVETSSCVQHNLCWRYAVVVWEIAVRYTNRFNRKKKGREETPSVSWLMVGPLRTELYGYRWGKHTATTHGPPHARTQIHLLRALFFFSLSLYSLLWFFFLFVLLFPSASDSANEVLIVFPDGTY